MSISAILIFIVILLILVIVHEFGHFIVAKWTNMRVDEFAFGFPPKLFGKKIGETTYSINALPIGGYVSIWGENGSEEDGAEGGAKNSPRAFGNRPAWAQLLVLVAGVTMNMLLALVIFIGVSYGSIEMSANDEVYGSRIKDTSLMVTDAYNDSPAYKAGITPGTTLISVVSRGEKSDLSSPQSLISFIEKHSDDSFLITYKGVNNVVSSTTISSVYGIVPDKKAIGISVISVGYINTTIIEAIKIGSVRTYDMTVLILDGLKSLVISVYHGESVLKSLSGPVGIARIVGQTSEYGVGPILILTALLSINLAIFNILPLPALDGGRMIMVVVETVIRRKIPFKYYSWVNIVGFVALMLLLVVVTINDLVK